MEVTTCIIIIILAPKFMCSIGYVASRALCLSSIDDNYHLPSWEDQ